MQTDVSKRQVQGIEIWVRVSQVKKRWGRFSRRAQTRGNEKFSDKEIP